MTSAFLRPRAAATVCLTALMAPLLAGCFSPAPESTPGLSAGSERVSMAMLQPPRSGLSPLSDDAFKLSRWSTAETLVVLDDLAEAHPGLATSWERTDETTWSFTIRESVTFHDGTSLTPEAVANALTRAATAVPVPRILNGVDLTAVAEEGRVVVSTAQPDPLLMGSSRASGRLGPVAAGGSALSSSDRCLRSCGRPCARWSWGGRSLLGCRAPESCCPGEHSLH